MVGAKRAPHAFQPPPDTFLLAPTTPLTFTFISSFTTICCCCCFASLPLLYPPSPIQRNTARVALLVQRVGVKREADLAWMPPLHQALGAAQKVAMALAPPSPRKKGGMSGVCTGLGHAATLPSSTQDALDHATGPCVLFSFFSSFFS